MEAAINEPRDEGERPTLAEPLIVAEESPHRAGLNDRALDLAVRSAALRAALPVSLRTALAKAVREMNCYYSNLIEGHDTHPIDIERALKSDYSNDPKKRDLQLEALAHIEVQAWIDEGGLAHHPLAPASLVEIHRRFCGALPKSLLVTNNPETGETMQVEPGAFRTAFVRVGRHIPPSPGAIPRFLDYIHAGYTRLGRASQIVGMACAHHRLAWVHPFLDGNGRVMRMVSHAMARDLAESEGLWSISRGLARNVDTYKRLLADADSTRRGDRDGRGNLSESALAAFAAFFLDVSIDQVTFMSGLIDPARLHDRVLRWTGEEIAAGRLPQKADLLMRIMLAQGEVERAAVPAALGLKDRMARVVTAALLEAGALTSEHNRAPLKLAFSPRLAPRWMPGLFPDRPAA
jgi:Fic family protein